jgi:hypothetical protein
MLSKVCFLLLAIGVFGCDIFDTCGPFSTNKTNFQDSLTAHVPNDSIKLQIFADYEYDGQIPVTIIRTAQFSDSLNFIGAFEGNKGPSKAEMRNDTLILSFGYYSIITAKGTASGAKGNSFDPLCSPPADRTTLLSATLTIPSDLAVSIIWPSTIKIIE